MHGGSLTAQSSGEGRGSEFVMRLPLTGPENGAGGERRREVTAAAPGDTTVHRILVVDDLVEVAEDMACLLREGLGHDVRTAHDGPAALAAARDFRPELVLLDIGLPGTSGYDLARRLRREAGLEHILLVALTGYGQEEDRRQALEAGFDHHLVKPVGLESIRPLLETLK